MLSSPYPRLHRTFDLTVVPAKNATSTLALSNPDIGPQSSPRARAASMKYAPCSDEFRSAVREEPFILREPGSGTRTVEERALARLKLPMGVVMALGSTEAIKRVVAEGVGLAIVSRLAVAAECTADTLAVLPVAGMHIERSLHLVRRKGRRDGPAMRTFCDLLRERTAARFG